MSDPEKVRENRVRRAALRQGLILAKSRRRDPRATDHGTYMLRSTRTNAVVASGLQAGYGMSLDDVEDQLAGTSPMTLRDKVRAIIYTVLDEDRQQLILDYSQQLVEEQLLEEQRAANRV